MYMYVITIIIYWTCNLFQVEIIAWVSFLSFDSDVTSHTPALCVSGYIYESKFGMWGIYYFQLTQSDIPIRESVYISFY